ncbi:hypothetical protein NPIL_299501 [Nephila pilipes]|uniref:Uncharacterized protein n=1 Tax=Nephila pilipes TaxID=299642 RepID=A0A8X6T6Z1_NEPPI|nr:hypothetical protein NPIL_299501 [Nephila pilipes]
MVAAYGGWLVTQSSPWHVQLYGAYNPAPWILVEEMNKRIEVLAFKDDLLVVPSIIFLRSIKSIKVGIRNKLSIFSSQVLEKIFHHAIPVRSPCLGRLGGVCCCTVALLWWLLWGIQWLRSSISRLQPLWSLQPCSWILVEEMSKRIEAVKDSVLIRRPGTYVKNSLNAVTV